MSIIIAIPMVTICYLLVNVSYLAVMSPSEMMISEAVAVVSPSLLDNAPNYVPSWVRYPKEKKICSMIILCTFECDVCKNTKI